FSPESFIKAIELCESSANTEVIVIDSISMEWDGAGGVLEIHSSMIGNSFTNWNKVTPRHNAFVQKMLQSPCHIIATVRSKQDYVLSEKNGKMVPEKVGLKGVTREGMDYEFTLMLDLDIKHNASASKDRTGLFMDKPEFIITTSTGKRILAWCNTGNSSDVESLEIIKTEINSAKDIETLRAILQRYPEYRTTIEPLCIAAKNAMTNSLTVQSSTQIK
ncbi:MAG TPA: AAA family ATPase, partial [Tenuifilaceae bacterium]|nr:AAA family ATPase [Tenuifilaceae bacterium]